MKPMMKCGHQANTTKDGKPACVICAGSPAADEIADSPNLEGRQAECWHCGTTKPSTLSGQLAFFEYRGDNKRLCECGFANTTHLSVCAINPFTRKPNKTDHKFKAKVFEFDSFYCGCRGWD